MPNSQLLDSRYKFLKPLGSDPQGSTCLVVDTFLDTHPKCVVKKFPLPGKSSKAVRFILVLLKKKAEALKHVSHHDQVPKILTYFEDESFFYLVEEFIPGRPLSQILKPRKVFSEGTVQTLVRETLKILLVVHSWGVIHRCITPSNIIQRTPDNHLVLTGFGIFKEISSQNDQGNKNGYHQNSGTFPSVYVPVDQSAGKRHFSSDIYAVGMIGIQALTGLPPSELRHLKRVETSNQGYIPESLSWHNYAKVSPGFRSILDRMISPSLEHRYTTAANVLEDLDKLIEQHSSSEVQNISSTPERVRQHHVTSTNTTTYPSAIALPANSIRPKSNRTLPLILGAGALLAIVLGLLFSQTPQRLWSTHAIKKGQDFEQNENFESAITQYTQAIETYPTAEAYVQRGIAYFLSGELGLSQDDLNRSIELDNTKSDAYYYRGNVRHSLGNLQGAMEDYTQAIQLDPNNSLKAFVNRGTVREKLSDHEGAIADYGEAIQQDPNFAPAYLNRCLSHSNIGNHQAAIKDCSQAIRLTPDSVLAYQNRGLVRRRLGDIMGSIQDLNIAINLDSEDPDPYYNRGLARIEIGDTVGAIADFTQAIDLDPEHPFAYYDRAIAKIEDNDINSAISDLEQSAKLCLDAGRLNCYTDAQYQINQIQGLSPEPETNE